MGDSGIEYGMGRAQERSRTEPESTGGPIREAVTQALEGYFRQLNGYDCSGLYRLVLTEVEVPMLRAVMDYCVGNQTRAAQLLGINRATLRKKLRNYGLDE